MKEFEKVQQGSGKQKFGPYETQRNPIYAQEFA